MSNVSHHQFILKLQNICLSYGKMNVLDKMNITLQRGKIHVVLGEHGAGKSSVAQIISGYTSPDQGQIMLNNNSYTSLSLPMAKKNKIHMIYQESALNTNFTVAENLFYSDTRLPFFSWRFNHRLIEEAKAYIQRYEFAISPKMETKNLNLSDRTIVEFLANMVNEPEILILDESLEKISATDLPKILDIIKNLKTKGCSVLIITHKIEGIYELADYISIVRDGKNFYSDDIKLTNKLQLIKMAYTQMAEVDYQKDQFHTFYQLIKYNEAILLNLPVNLIIIDTKKIIQLLNRFCSKNFAINLMDFIGQPVETLFEKTSTTTFDLILNAINDCKEQQFYQIELAINGKEGVFNLRLFPVSDDGFLIGVIILLENISEYIFEQQKDFLSDKLASIGLLAASIAHEVNNPLEIVYNYLRNIRFKYNNRDLLQMVGNMEHELEYISHIISNLQSFSDGGHTGNDETEINGEIKDIIHLLHPSLTVKKITAHFDPQNTFFLIMINRNEFKQVILNLFKNSIEAMSDGGEIFITTYQNFGRNTDNLKIVFRDTGTGIPNDTNLFTPFYSTKGKNRKNSGLGLSVSYSIIKKYNGTISLSNAWKNGCTVVITLPMKADLKSPEL